MLRVALAIPTYGPVDQQCARSVRTAMMMATNRGHHQFVGDASPDRMPYGSARNLAVKAVRMMPDQVDGIVWTDSDIVCQPETYWKLLSTAESFNIDFLSGLYHHRRGEYQPVFYRYIPDRDTFQQANFYEVDKRFPMDGCGFGIVYTSMNALDKIAKLPDFDEEKGAWFPDRREGYGKFGEDLGFCRQAMKAGVQLHVDTGIGVGHTGDPMVVDRETYVQRMSKDGITRVELA